MALGQWLASGYPALALSLRERGSSPFSLGEKGEDEGATRTRIAIASFYVNSNR
jgi:hypothetical protein